MEPKKLWIVTIVFAVAAYLFFSNLLPHLLSNVSEAVGVADVQEQVRESVSWAYHIIGLVAAAVILLLPFLGDFRK